MAQHEDNVDASGCMVYLTEERGGVWTVASDECTKSGAREDGRFSSFALGFARAIQLAASLDCELLVHSTTRGSNLMTRQEVRQASGFSPMV